jgi:tRNA pseudouridine55 synthase
VHGIVVVDKPAGLTSADVVAEVKRRLGADRVGHTGTLDPMATGVLPIAIGEATKLAPFLLADDKTYEGELELGVTTDTLDAEGTVTARADASQVTEAALRDALAAWVGEHVQVPPMFSALRQGGRRLHELARAGVEVERAARPVRIDRLELLGFAPQGDPTGRPASPALTDLGAPRARFAVACGKGTYVRALVRDVGAALGCGATLTALRRTRAGRFTLADAVALADAHRARPIDLAVAVDDLPAVALDAAGMRAVRHGQPLPAPGPGRFRLLTPSGQLAALADVREGRLVYLRVFNYGLTAEGA